MTIITQLAWGVVVLRYALCLVAGGLQV